MADEMTTETTEQTTETPAATETVATPEYLGGAEYAELMADESAANILSSYQDPASMAKGIVEKERLLASGLRIPKSLKPEHVEQLKPHIDAILGVPDKPEGYQMTRPEEIDESLDFSEQTKMELRAVAKTGGVGEQAFQGLYEKALQAAKRNQTERQNAEVEQREETRKGTVALMQKYWGPNEYQRLAGDGEKGGLIDQFVKSRAGDDAEFQEFKAAMDSTGLRNHPLMFKVLGDAARFYEIMEGGGKINPPEYAATAGAKALSGEAKAAKAFPNTPISLGGGAAG